MSPHFGAKVTSQPEYDKAVREEKGGANVFGTRVRSSIPESGPTNLAKRNSEFGPNVLEGAHGSDTKGKPAESVSLEELRDLLAENPTFLDSLFEAELARSEGARPEALKILRETERGIKGQMREDVLRDIADLLGETAGESAASANNISAMRQQSANMAERTKENALLIDADRIKSLKERAENLKIVQQHDKEGTATSQIAIDTASQADAMNSHKGESAKSAGGPESSARPAGHTHVETQSPGKRGDGRDAGETEIEGSKEVSTKTAAKKSSSRSKRK